MDEVVGLLWGSEAAPRRGPKRTLSLADIAGAGIALADAEGLAAVTMQRVAEALGVTKMALYRYVPGKDELVALMIEAAIGAAPRLDGAWRDRLSAWGRRLFDRFVRHPWVIEATVGVRVPGPLELDWLERAVSALDGTGLTGAETLDVAVTLVGHVRTIAQQGAATANPEQAVAATVADLLAGREDRYPALTAAFASAASGGQDNALEFGLARILDGVELLISGR